MCKPNNNSLCTVLTNTSHQKKKKKRPKKVNPSACLWPTIIVTLKAVIDGK